MNVWGYFCAFVAAVVFGLQYTPVKAFPVYDGLKFQWFMGCGIAFSGFVSAMVLNQPFQTDSVYLIPHGIVGGALWGTSNVLTLPCVKLLGIGVGFALYHSVNMALGYTIGRFGLWGAPKDDPVNGPLRDCGLGLLLVSLVLMIYVEPEIVDLDGADDGELAVPPPQATAVAAAAGRSGPSPPASRSSPSVVVIPPPRDYRATATSWADERVSLLRAAARDPAREKPRRLQHMSTGRLDELSLEGGTRAMRQAYKNWRSGGAKGAVTASTGFVGGSRQPLNRRAVARRAAKVWPLFGAEDTSYHTAYRTMIYAHGGKKKKKKMRRTPAEKEGDGDDDDDDTTTDASGDDEKRTVARRQAVLVGTACGLCAGLLCGVNMLPYTIFIEHLAEREGRAITGSETMNFFFSQCLGVFLAATAWLLFFTAVARAAQVEIRTPAIWPAWVAGTFWAAGFLFSSMAISQLGMGLAYTLDAIGPVMLSACISYACGEIVGRRNSTLFLVALGTQFVGVLAIAVGT